MAARSTHRASHPEIRGTQGRDRVHRRGAPRRRRWCTNPVLLPALGPGTERTLSFTLLPGRTASGRSRVATHRRTAARRRTRSSRRSCNPFRCHRTPCRVSAGMRWGSCRSACRRRVADRGAFVVSVERAGTCRPHPESAGETSGCRPHLGNPDVTGGRSGQTPADPHERAVVHAGRWVSLDAYHQAHHRVAPKCRERGTGARPVPGMRPRHGLSRTLDLSNRASTPATTTERIGHELLTFAHPDVGSLAA